MADRGPEFPQAPPPTLPEILGISPERESEILPYFIVRAFSDESKGFLVLNATAEQRFWENLLNLPQFSHTRPIIIDLDYIGTTEQNAAAGDWSQVDEKIREGLQLLCQKTEKKGGFAYLFRTGGDEFRVVLLDHFDQGQKEELLKSWQGEANERGITFRAACLVSQAPGLSLKDFLQRARSAADRIWKTQKELEKGETYWAEYKPEDLFGFEKMTLEPNPPPVEVSEGPDWEYKADALLGPWGVYSQEAASEEINKKMTSQDSIAGQVLVLPLVDMSFTNEKFGHQGGNQALKFSYSHLFCKVGQFIKENEGKGELLTFKAGAKVVFLWIGEQVDLNPLRENISQTLAVLQEGDYGRCFTFEPFFLEKKWQGQEGKFGIDQEKFREFARFVSFLLENQDKGVNSTSEVVRQLAD